MPERPAAVNTPVRIATHEASALSRPHLAARPCFWALPSPDAFSQTLAYGCKLLGFPRQDPDPGEKYVNRR